MTRRYFLRILTGGSAVLSAFTLPVSARVPNKSVLLLHTEIAGLPYYEGYELRFRLKDDQALQLRREPDNSYDPLAIEVYADSVKLGYIPRISNKVLARLLDAGVPLSARVAPVDDFYRAYPHVFIEVFLEDSFSTVKLMPDGPFV